MVSKARALSHYSGEAISSEKGGLSILLADERTGNLGSQTGDQVFELLRRFNRDEGTAFLVVTHDPRIAGSARTWTS